MHHYFCPNAAAHSNCRDDEHAQSREKSYQTNWLCKNSALRLRIASDYLRQKQKADGILCYALSFHTSPKGNNLMPEPSEPNPALVDAWPTKDFFISMLTKDIELVRSIIDLVDNALDGARRLRKQNDYSGLFVKIDATPQRFTIVDNCGGIDINLARDYAFRFGRSSKMKPTPHSVGQFGVGMKRSLFKLGKKFLIRSDAPTSWFVLKVDVDDWKKDDRKWEFEFDEFAEDLPIDKEGNLGTSITVSSLHAAVSEAFSDENFHTRLAKEIREAHTQTLEKGLRVSLGGVPLDVRPLMFLESKDLKPALHEMSWGKGQSEVSVKLYAGISDSKPSEAGWNVFCNGRLVIAADRTLVTGWGENGGKLVPHFHPQFSRFRGYAFLDSADTSALPWNTTKTGVDTDSPNYKSVRVEMIKLMRPVIDFLNALASEKKVQNEDERTLQMTIDAAKSSDITEVQVSHAFKSPKVSSVRTPAEPELTRIAYWKPKKQADEVKKKLKVSTSRQIGEKTFEYFYKRECEE